MKTNTTRTTPDVIVIGAGPAGLMAAIAAAEAGARTLILESGPRPGRKLLATGGGRCNLTHAGEIADFLAGFEKKTARFLKPAAYALPPAALMTWFESHGVPLKEERGARVFPQSDRASDVLDTLLAALKACGGEVVCRAQVSAVAHENNLFTVETSRGPITAPCLVIATGGLSLQRSGATGDGYRFASDLGHAIETPRPSLVPLICAETWPETIAGLALKNVRLSVTAPGGRVSRFGEMIFTHHGIGGPITLEVSRFITDALHDGGGPLAAEIDLKPALEDNLLDNRLLREIAENPRRSISALLGSLLPRALVAPFASLCGLTDNTTANQINRDIRTTIRRRLKAMPLTITGTEPLEAALVTRGGVALGEIDSRTMASRVMPGLFLAGEVIDADGDCGGYNLQLCWATGKLAGTSAAAWVGAVGGNIGATGVASDGIEEITEVESGAEDASTDNGEE